jgi:peptide-methionine (R)-S-oxide reductase
MLLIILLLLTFACQPAAQSAKPLIGIQGDTVKIVAKSDAEWKKLLTPQQYEVLRNSGTERAFTGKLLLNKKNGVYTCAGCGLPLFVSDAKYDSGSGWPSYYQPFHKNNVIEKIDLSHGMRRTEIRCAGCNGHLGHMFDDGPKPTGLRYCINSASLDFVEKNK